ncbi:MAG: TRAP transporter fused permease subunit [Pseudomonadota bacterium]
MTEADKPDSWRDKLSNSLATLVIAVVLANAIPEGVGLPTVNFTEEFLKVFAFFFLMVALLLRSPFAKLTRSNTAQRIIEAICFFAIAYFSFTYLNELLMEKPDLFPESWQVGSDPMARLLEGVPTWVAVAAVLAAAVLLFMNWHIWGAGIASIAIFCAMYVVIAAIGTHFGWFEGNKFLSYVPAATDPKGEIHKWLIVGDDHSLLGRFPGILLNIVVPFVVLGSLFSQTGGGKSLIKLAFKLSRNLRGGPGHAAIMSSSIFGTMSGGPVVNVLATGTLTIPMMLKRKFSPTFAGGVESAASSGGQIVPPVMGVAAFFLADFTGVPYSQVVLAALIPACLYYFTLFTSVSIEARKLKLEPIGDNLPDEFRMHKQDYINLWIVLIPIGIIVAVLASQAFSVTAAGMFAVMSLVVVSFLDPDVRKNPWLLISALGKAGNQAARIMLLFMAVAIVAASLSATGFTNSFGTLVAQIVEDSLSFNLFGAEFTLPTAASQFVVLGVTMVLALLLGMGMPTLPAYVNVTIVMAAVLGNIGLGVFTANMFVFYFAVASAITPPVAIAAFAAASITRADPLHTGLMSLRLGIAMFIIPFVFAFYPELLIIDAAFVADSTSGRLIESRPDGFQLSAFISILPRICLCIVLLASAFSAYDFRRLPKLETTLRLLLVIPCLMPMVWLYLPCCIVAVALIANSIRLSRRTAAVPAQ